MKNPLLDHRFRFVSFGVRVGYDLNSCSSRVNVCLRVALSAGPSSFPTKSSTVDDNSTIVRPLDALRPLTLCNCDHAPGPKTHLVQAMTDNIFEVEMTALARVACATQDSGILLTDFAAAYPSVNHSWIFHVLEKAELLGLICRFLRSIYFNSRKPEDNSSWPEVSGKAALRVASYSPWRSTPSFDGSTTQSSQESLPPLTFSNPPPSLTPSRRVPVLMILRWLLRPSGR